MQVHDGLAGTKATVDPDVVTIRLKLIVEQSFRLFKEVVDSVPLFPGAGEEIGYMAAGDDQRMSRVDREFVISNPGQLVFQDHFFRVAEGAFNRG